MRWIYLSPHFDDAVLSCGGLIWEQNHSGIPVEIWTINAADPPAGPDSDLITRVHAQWRTGTPQETVELRREEDRHAARILGAGVRHLKMVDAIYRRTATGALLYTQDVFDPIDLREAGIVGQAAGEIGQHLNNSDTLVCPLALGGHVDHVIARHAVESLSSPAITITYYADIPYLFGHEQELAAASEGLSEHQYYVSDQGLAAWMDGISAYRSQISSLFEDEQTMRSQMQAYHTSRNGQILWKSM
jgi:LmbE family N-acetylglucosaminyl deacetylase